MTVENFNAMTSFFEKYCISVLVCVIRSEVVVFDILHKNDMSNTGMLEIMEAQQTFLEHNCIVLLGGDQLTSERQRCAKTHVMNGDTQEDCLDLLEPVVEDWHALQSFLGVSVCVCVHIFAYSN